MEEKLIAFIYAILALLILGQIRRSFKMIFRTHLIENFWYFSEVKIFEIRHQNNYVQLSGDEIVNIISNKLLFKKVKYNEEIISQVLTIIYDIPNVERLENTCNSIV